MILLVRALPTDEEDIFRWRNDHLIRQYASNSNEIRWADHKRWFSDSLKDQNRYLFIAKQNGESIGVLRLDVLNDTAEISIFVLPELVGKGYGAGIIEAAILWSEENLKVDQLTAKVLKQNKASVKLFDKFEFVVRKSLNNWLYYEKKIRL